MRTFCLFGIFVSKLAFSPIKLSGKGAHCKHVIQENEDIVDRGGLTSALACCSWQCAGRSPARRRVTGPHRTAYLLPLSLRMSQYFDARAEKSGKMTRNMTCAVEDAQHDITSHRDG